MARPKNEFQSIEQIADIAGKLKSLSESTLALANSLGLLTATGAEMHASSGAEEAIATIDNWISSGYLQISKQVDANKKLGKNPPAGIVTAYNRIAVDSAENNEKKISKKKTKTRAAK